MSMRIGVTGGGGFLGWHVFCHSLTRDDVEVYRIPRDALVSAEQLAPHLAGCSSLLHLAGVNRAPDEEVRRENLRLADVVAGAVARTPELRGMVFANSVQAEGSSVYGAAKRDAAEILAQAANGRDAAFADVLLPNLFGEHGRPFYNSFVATFCHQFAVGEEPRVNGAGEVPLLHAQEAARVLADAAVQGRSGRLSPPGRLVRVQDVADLLARQSDSYASGVIPPLNDAFETSLFNQLRSYARRVSPFATGPTRFDLGDPLVRHSDARGDLVETVRSRSGEGQVFVSTTRPGITRGNHFHTRKVERFVVLSGQAVIGLRRLGFDEPLDIAVSGDAPVIVDQPTLWTHNITNVGDTELLTLFWVNEIFDPSDSDTYPQPVTP